MIKVSGNMISPYEVEKTVLEIPIIRECAVVSAPHTIKGRCIHLFVVLENNFENIESEIKNQGKFNILISMNLSILVSTRQRNRGIGAYFDIPYLKNILEKCLFCRFR